jgi:hypothetical protein
MRFKGNTLLALKQFEGRSCGRVMLGAWKLKATEILLTAKLKLTNIDQMRGIISIKP